MKKLVLFSVLFLSVLMLSAQTEKKEVQVAKKQNGPEITFKTLTHNYGEIYNGSDGNYRFEFTNTGNEPLILTKPRSSCGCTVPHWPKEPILPGESSAIKVTYNTHKNGSFNKTVTVYSNSVKNKTVVLRIKGKVIPKPAETLPEKPKTGVTPKNK
jgi:hypothetical protein